MIFVRRLSMILLLLASAMLAACFDYREELWIESNGSGKLQATLTIHSAGVGDSQELQTEILRLFEESEGAEVRSYRSTPQDGVHTHEITLFISDIRQWRPAMISGQKNPAALFGDFKIQSGQGGNLSIRRKVELADLPENASEKKDPPIPANFGKDHTLEYTMHFPNQVVSANSNQILSDTHTVSWSVPLDQAFREPIVMEAEIKKSGSWLLWSFLGFGVLVTAAIVLPAILRKPPAAD